MMCLSVSAHGVFANMFVRGGGGGIVGRACMDVGGSTVGGACMDGGANGQM